MAGEPSEIQKLQEPNRLKVVPTTATFRTKDGKKEFTGWNPVSVGTVLDYCNDNQNDLNEDAPEIGYDKHVVVLVADENKLFSDALLSQKDSANKSVQLAILPLGDEQAAEAAIANLWYLAGQGLNIVVPLGSDERFPKEMVLFSENGNKERESKLAEIKNSDLQVFYIKQLKKLKEFLAKSEKERVAWLNANYTDPFRNAYVKGAGARRKAPPLPPGLQATSISSSAGTAELSFKAEIKAQLITLLGGSSATSRYTLHDKTLNLIEVKDKTSNNILFTISPSAIEASGLNQDDKTYKAMIEAALTAYPDQELEINVPASEKAEFDKCLSDNLNLKQRLEATQSVISYGKSLPPTTPTRTWPEEPVQEASKQGSTTTPKPPTSADVPAQVTDEERSDHQLLLDIAQDGLDGCTIYDEHKQLITGILKEEQYSDIFEIGKKTPTSPNIISKTDIFITLKYPTNSEHQKLHEALQGALNKILQDGGKENDTEQKIGIIKIKNRDIQDILEQCNTSPQPKR